MSVSKHFYFLAVALFSSAAMAQSAGFSDPNLEMLRQVCIDPQSPRAARLRPDTCEKNKKLFFMLYPDARPEDYAKAPDLEKKSPEPKKPKM